MSHFINGEYIITEDVLFFHKDVYIMLAKQKKVKIEKIQDGYKVYYDKRVWFKISDEEGEQNLLPHTKNRDGAIIDINQSGDRIVWMEG